jgi:hypothetical protein
MKNNLLIYILLFNKDSQIFENNQEIEVYQL